MNLEIMNLQLCLERWVCFNNYFFIQTAEIETCPIIRWFIRIACQGFLPYKYDGMDPLCVSLLYNPQSFPIWSSGHLWPSADGAGTYTART